MANNTSDEPGYLQPVGAQPPEGADLQVILHDWIVGLSTVDPTLVRPAFQPEPPNVPAAPATLWIAFSIEDVESDTYPQIIHYPGSEPASDGFDRLQRQETLDLVLHIYDLGAGSPARAMAKLIRDNTAITQNLEVLRTQNIGLVECLQPIPVPSLMKMRWRYRLDMTIRLRRMVTRDYQVLDVLSAAGSVEDQDGFTSPFDTENKPL